MSALLGIDIGGSMTKIVGFQEGRWLGALQIATEDQITALYGAIGRFTQEHEIPLDSIGRMVITGVGATRIEGDIFGVPTSKVDEFKAIALGGLYLSGKQEAIVVSMGTGTAYVRAARGEAPVHIGGSGVGGGTLMGLSKVLLGEEDFGHLIDLAKAGDETRVDLTVKDISSGHIDTLPPYLTASNFGKMKSTAPEDLAAALVNMVFQTIGMLAVFLCKNDVIQDVVLTGTLTTLPQAAKIFQLLQELHGVRFTIPQRAGYATAIGAILGWEEQEGHF